MHSFIVQEVAEIHRAELIAGARRERRSRTTAHRVGVLARLRSAGRRRPRRIAPAGGVDSNVAAMTT